MIESAEHEGCRGPDRASLRGCLSIGDNARTFRLGVQDLRALTEDRSLRSSRDEGLLMNHSRSTPSACRDDVLAFLSDDERRSLASAPTHRFNVGDEFLDLEKLGEGVRVARGSGPPVAGLLPRAAVQDATWKKVLSYLEVMRTHPVAKDR